MNEYSCLRDTEIYSNRHQGLQAISLILINCYFVTRSQKKRVHFYNTDTSQ